MSKLSSFFAVISLGAFLLLGACSEEEAVKGSSCNNSFNKCDNNKGTACPSGMICGSKGNQKNPVANVCRFSPCSIDGSVCATGNGAKGFCFAGSCLEELPCTKANKGKGCGETGACFVHAVDAKAGTLGICESINRFSSSSCKANCAKGQIKVVDYSLANYTCQNASCKCVASRTCKNDYKVCKESSECSNGMECDSIGEVSLCKFSECNDQDPYCKLASGKLGLCVAGQCLPSLPCGFDGKKDSCSEDQACFIASGSAGVGACSPISKEAKNCGQKCPEGHVRVLDYDKNNYRCETASCSCVKIQDAPKVPPKVSLGRVNPGMHSDLVHIQGTSDFYVSSYYPGYGDLILMKFSEKTPGKVEFIETRILDGVPSGCTPLGDPNGFRGGCIEPGDDVGWYTSMVLDNQKTLHIIYYDRSNTSLKYVSFNVASGKMGPATTIDKGDCLIPDGTICKLKGATGLHSSLSLDTLGNLHASFMRNAALNSKGKLVAQLKYAFMDAKTATWKVSLVDEAFRAHDDLTRNCVSTPCATGQECVGIGHMDVCLAPTKDCKDKAGKDLCDANKQVCNKGLCFNKAKMSNLIQPERALAKGTNLLLDLNKNRIYIAYYDNVNRSLKFADAPLGKGVNLESKDFSKDIVDGLSVELGKTPCEKDADCKHGFLSCQSRLCSQKACQKNADCGGGTCKNSLCQSSRKVILGDRSCKTTKDCGYNLGFECKAELCEKDAFRNNQGDFPSLSMLPGGDLLISYYDYSHKAVALLQGKSISELKSAIVSLVDTGVVPGNMRFVGSESRVLALAANSAFLVYQDSTKNDVYRAFTKSSFKSNKLLKWDKPKLNLEKGVFGYYLRLVKVGSAVYLGHYQIATQKNGTKVVDQSQYKILKVYP